MTTNELIDLLEASYLASGNATSIRIVEHLRTLEAESELLLDVLRAAREAGEAAFWGESVTSVERVNYAADCLQRAVDACSHIEIGEKG